MYIQSMKKLFQYEAKYEIKHGIFLHKNIDTLLSLCDSRVDLSSSTYYC